MGIDRDTLAQLKQLLRPLATRIANSIARSVVQLVDDEKKLQLVQLGVLDGEDVPEGEHHQPYGFSSVPLAGAEAVVVFPNGDRSHPLVITASDRRHRPTGGEPGQVTMYHHGGAKVTMLANGNITVRPGPGGQVLVDDGSGAEPLVKRSEFLTHGHPIIAQAATTPCAGPVTGAAPGSSLTFPGTGVLRAK
jgi:phage baseplate assembly protein V